MKKKVLCLDNRDKNVGHVCESKCYMKKFSKFNEIFNILHFHLNIDNEER